MTAKDFILIATVLNKALKSDIPEEGKEAIRTVCYMFAVELRKTNRRFDADRWYAACFGGTGHVHSRESVS